MGLRDKLKSINRQQQMGSKSKSKSNKNLLKMDEITAWLKGKEVENDGGTIFQKEYIFPLSYQHGRYCLQEIHNPGIESIHYMLQQRQNFTCEDLLFLDTETTGLGGAGTSVFLIGLGYFVDEKFIIKQLMMRDLDEEVSLLTAINDLLTGFSVLVSFNGKCFDLPVLTDRFILNRLERFDIKEHLDLIHPARRIWSHLDSCSLNNLEQQVLNIGRDEDLPGAEVPSYYFKYLKEGNPRYLQPILRHNLIDIKSLVSLLILLNQIYTIDFNIELTPQERYNLARYQEKRKLLSTSIQNYEKAYHSVSDKILEKDIEKKLSWQYKRVGNWEMAINIWQKMIKAGRGGLFPFVELAKYYEHKEKNIQQALNQTNAALDFFRRNRSLIKKWCQQKEKLHHRRHRLQRKLE